MASTSDDPPFDLEASLYGPGSLACWYLTILCLFLTWASHPTKRFHRLSVSADMVLYALYACIATGHMAVMITRFASDDIAAFKESHGLSWTRVHREQPIDEKPHRPLTSTQREMIAGIDAPFSVGIIFLSINTLALISVVGVDDDEVRPRRWRPFPWLLLITELWVSGCFCFLSARCGLGTVLTAMALFAFELVVRFLVAACLVFAELAIVMFCGELLRQCGKKMYPGTRYRREWWSRTNLFRGILQVLATHVTWFNISGAVTGLVFLASVYALAVFLAWQLLQWFGSVVSGVWFPDVGVRLSALDQILALSSGLVAAIFNIDMAVGDRGLQARFWRYRSKRIAASATRGLVDQVGERTLGTHETEHEVETGDPEIGNVERTGGFPARAETV